MPVESRGLRVGINFIEKTAKKILSIQKNSVTLQRKIGQAAAHYSEEDAEAPTKAKPREEGNAGRS